MALEHRAKANGHRYREAKRRFVANAEPICAICGQYIDKSLPWPHPRSPSVDHIVPLAKGGKAMDRTGWQLVCLACNQSKSDKVAADTSAAQAVAKREQINAILLAQSTGPCAGWSHTTENWYADPALLDCPKGHGVHLSLLTPSR